MTIKKSLQSSILLIAVIPVILMATLAYIFAANKYVAINIENTEKMATDYSYGISTQLEYQISETTSIANLNDTKHYLLEKINSPDILLQDTSNCYDNIKDTIIQISNSFDNNVHFYIYDIDGYLCITSSDQCFSDWNEIMSDSISTYSDVSILSHSSFTNNTLDILVPVIVKDKTIGLIRTNINATYLEPYLTNNTTTTSFLLDETNQPLFGYTPTDHNDTDYINALQPDASKGIQTSGTITSTHDYIYGYATIPKYHLTYTLRQNNKYNTSIFSSLPIVFLVVLVTVMIMAIRISHNLASKYTQPIIELNHKMQEAADGKLDVHCSISRDDEFGTLSNHFNQMMQIISTNYNELQQAHQKLEANQLELKDNYKNIEKLAYTDTLTGLYNRTAFFEFANKILADSKVGSKTHALIFIDLDGFKSINDTLGHDYGDLLLKAVSAQFTSFISEDDLLARNGGDEFVILKNNVTSHEELETFLTSLISIASHPFLLEDETAHISLSAGVSIFPKNGLSLSELMKNADIAMYTSKNAGKNRYTFFSSTMEDEVNRRNEIIDVLRNAIANKEVYLLYQPQADIFTGEIIGYEALMRLNSPILGFVSPDEFIPIAEECGLIDELGEWALLEACRFNQRLIDSGFKPIRVSVNVSTAQLRSDRLIKVIESVPEKTAMPLQYLELELTESVLMKNFDHNLALINKIKKLGIHIALDDFGTGYSSFSYLTKIPINTLKIDKSFIAGICDNTNDSYIAGTIINLAHQLGITVIAEGVETIEQLRILQNQMCDILQGYFFSRALSESDFIELLKINS